MIEELIDELISYISVSGREEEVAKVKDDYFSQVGGISGDEDSFDMRMGTFFEWYLIDRRLGGTSILEEYAASIVDGNKEAQFLNLRNGIRSIFEVTGSYEDRLNLRDLNGKKKYVAMTPWGNPYFRKKNLLEVRLIPEGDKFIMSQSYVIHPESVKKFIVARLKEGALCKDKDRIINALSIMSFKWEKFRKFKIEDIYKK